MENELNRPITVRIEDLIQEINNSVMKSELPAYLVVPFLKDYLSKLKKIAKQEYTQGRIEWEKDCNEINQNI